MKKIIITGLIVFYTVVPGFVLAGDTAPAVNTPTSGAGNAAPSLPTSGAGNAPSTPSAGPITPLTNPIKYDTFSDFVSAVIKAAVDILMPFVVLAFIWSGFLFVKAQGKPAEIEAAQKAITYSVIGAFILFGSWGFAQIIGTTISTLTK
ncbi:hypothetical protein AUJ77_01400 [Candidatus Nomurabacteria bacterium CG1_02_43_90]|uniref:Uncharacterized protein n=1 Tax=Candidatus Nomurabacteria bacterium CG1_02_43_90 TaxID=1805281 RepID=A0A1J4V4F5_9BACT|nr:MAG: hypothetical protein AUJ77_01400 [Candidatus Nomurabacteria bacterium CG1_02_43_90]